MSQQYKINDRVKVYFSIYADKKGFTGKTNHAIGTVLSITPRYTDEEQLTYSTVLYIEFDEEYHMERADKQKNHSIFQLLKEKNQEFITRMSYFVDNPEISNLYLLPTSIVLI